MPFYAVCVSRSCRHEEDKDQDKTVHVFHNTLQNMDAVTDDDSFYTVYQNLLL